MTTEPKTADEFSDSVTELFHPDMNYPDALIAIRALLKLYAAVESRPMATEPIAEAATACHAALWEDRPTRLDKDQALDAAVSKLLHARLFPGHESEETILKEFERLQRSDRNIRRLADQRVLQKWPEYKARALTEPTLAKALAMVSIWDTENAVRQAMRNTPDDERTPDGGLWETFVGGYIEEVLTAWGIAPNLTSSTVSLEHSRSTAALLWQLLDDIDSLSDQIKPSDEAGYKRFYERALNVAKARHQLLKSDGYRLERPVTPPESTKPLELLLSCPVCHVRHIDVGEFATKPHHTHTCQGCGHEWKVSKEPTVGVQFLSGHQNAPTGKELVGKRVRVLTPYAHSHEPLGSTHLVTKFDGPYADTNQERYHVLIGTGELHLRREEFEAL